MNSQNTPVHVKLWHREFWQLAIANLLLSMSVYMLLPILPIWLDKEENFTLTETGVSIGVFALGLFLLGPFVSYLVQHYRRNKVCLRAIVLLTACQGVLWYIDSMKSEFVEFWLILLQRFCLGALFGLAQMVLASTLVIDTCESYQRTEANHSASWFGRFALSLGPLTGLLIHQIWGFSVVIMVAMGLSLASLLLIRMVDFPFRAPEERVHVWSMDRFLLDTGGILFLNLLLITIVLGLCIGQMDTIEEFGMMMTGFLLALLAQRFMFRDAELKSEVVTGLILLMAALLINMTQHTQVAYYISSTFIGMASGIVGARFLLFFIKLSRHCQRGTSQSTFMLSWETGLALGVGITYILKELLPQHVNTVALALTVISLLMYNGITHNWFMNHKNR
jgi:MFS family permease